MNQPTTSPRRLHPLIATAAATIIIASLAATAAITGVFPKASGTGGETAQTQSAQVAQVANQPVVDTAAPAAVGGSQQQAAAQPPGAQAGEALFFGRGGCTASAATAFGYGPGAV